MTYLTDSSEDITLCAASEIQYLDGQRTDVDAYINGHWEPVIPINKEALRQPTVHHFLKEENLESLTEEQKERILEISRLK